MKVTGLIFILSFLAFKLILGDKSCITSYQSDVYLVETTNSSTNIKSFQPPSVPRNNNTTNTSNSNSNNNTSIPWKNGFETQQGVVSLFSCTTVHHYLFLLISPTIPIEQQQPNDGENVKSILTFDYQSHQWRTIPLYLDPSASTLIVSSWDTHYIVYNTVRHTVYYFDTQLWSWHSNDDQNDTLSPPSLSDTPTTTTIPEMATVNSSLYYFFNDEVDHHLNHIYAFDLMTLKWNGHFASFWSNGSSFYFSSDGINTLYAIPRLKNDNDKFMRTIHVNSTSALIVQTPTVELQANDFIASTMGGDLVVYNGTRLLIYQPATNTISAVYGQLDQVPPDGNSTASPPSSFWSTSEGERIKIALGCSLGIGMVIVTVIGAILLRNRRQHHDHDHQYHAKERDLIAPAPASAPASVRETNQHANTTGTPAPTMRTTKLSTSMQSLSFLARDNAMVWGKHVHQLLALITFRRQQEEEREEEEGADDDGDYPSMIKTSTTVSALAMSSMILSMISSSISATNNNNAFLTPPTPSTPMNRRSLDMACPLPRDPLGQAESSSSSPLPPPLCK